MIPKKRITMLEVEGYRSIQEQIVIKFPPNVPLVLIGENNAGKSNMIRALDLVLGEAWAGSHIPEDHEFWSRSPNNDSLISIKVHTAGIHSSDGTRIRAIHWEYQPKEKKPTYLAHYDGKNQWGKDAGFISNEIREQLTVVVIGADRNLDYQMSYRSKWTLLSKLMKKFHHSLTSDGDRVQRLKEKFEEITEIFGEVAEFADFQQTMSEHFNAMLSGMSYQLGIDFSAYDPSNYFRSLRVYPTENGETRTFEELGTGQEQVLAIAFAHAYAKAFYGGIVLVIEEPEAHLHPLAQRWLSRKISEMANDGLQIVLTTHSPAFVDLLNLPGLVLVRKEEGATVEKQLSAKELVKHCIEHGVPKEKIDESTILPFYAAASTPDILAGLFAKKVVLVEGPTEQLALPIYLQKIGLDTNREGVAIIPVMGKGSLARWWRFFTAYEIPTYVIFDNDSKDDKKGTKREDVLKTIGVEEHEIAQYIETSDWLIKDKFAVFGKDFEAALRKLHPEYGSLEEIAKETLGTSAKPLIARRVASELNLDSHEIWNKFRLLKENLECLGEPEKECFNDVLDEEDYFFPISDDDLPF